MQEHFLSRQLSGDQCIQYTDYAPVCCSKQAGTFRRPQHCCQRPECLIEGACQHQGARGRAMPGPRRRLLRYLCAVVPHHTCRNASRRMRSQARADALRWLVVTVSAPSGFECGLPLSQAMGQMHVRKMLNRQRYREWSTMFLPPWRIYSLWGRRKRNDAGYADAGALTHQTLHPGSDQFDF